MSRINDMSVSSRFVDLQEIEKNGGTTFKLQDKSVTENGVVIADPTYDGLSKVDVDVQGSASFFEEISLSIDNPTYSKTLTKGASIFLNKYVNMLVGRGDVTDTVESIGIDFATITYVDSTQVLTVALNTSHPEASEGVAFKVWGE